LLQTARNDYTHMPNTKSDKVLWPMNGCGDVILSSGQRTVVTSATLNGCHIFHLMYYLNWIY